MAARDFSASAAWPVCGVSPKTSPPDRRRSKVPMQGASKKMRQVFLRGFFRHPRRGRETCSCSTNPEDASHGSAPHYHAWAWYFAQWQGVAFQGLDLGVNICSSTVHMHVIPKSTSAILTGGTVTDVWTQKGDNYATTLKDSSTGQCMRPVQDRMSGRQKLAGPSTVSHHTMPSSFQQRQKRSAGHRAAKIARA